MSIMTVPVITWWCALTPAYAMAPRTLHDAVNGGNLLFVRSFIKELHADVNEHSCHFGRTPLHVAVERGRPEIVRELLATPGININACDINGQTPLHYAVAGGWHEIVAMLLAEPSIAANRPSRSGLRTPLGLAQLHGFASLVQRLREHLATQQFDGECPLCGRNADNVDYEDRTTTACCQRFMCCHDLITLIAANAPCMECHHRNVMESSREAGTHRAPGSSRRRYVAPMSRGPATYGAIGHFRHCQGVRCAFCRPHVLTPWRAESARIFMS